jgi:phosphopantothenoylcysteine decarboxylase/phosphopantothenate--cysteine ligase
MLIAPTTANMIAKLSHGLADDLLSTLYLAASCPIYIAPAMNQVMWNKPVVQDNITRLKNHHVKIIGPEAGEQACGDIGFGRMTEPADIFQFIHDKNTSDKVLKGLSVLISAGPTREPLDPVRYITNRSSGKMGYALAKAAKLAGAKVTLVSGPVALAAPDNINIVNVETAEQMHQAVISRASQHSIYIGAAAVADYSPLSVSPEKIKKQADDSVIHLKKTQDILATVASLPKRPFTVGFAAETQNLEQYALDKLKQKNLDMIAANWVGQESGGFDKDENALQIYWSHGHQSFDMMSKNKLATQLISLIAERINEKDTA